jgi:hypothetical protein
LQDALTVRRQALQQLCRVLVAAVLGPEQREDGKLEIARVTPEQLADAGELAVGQTERAVQRLCGNGRQVPDST